MAPSRDIYRLGNGLAGAPLPVGEVNDPAQDEFDVWVNSNATRMYLSRGTLGGNVDLYVANQQ